MPQIVTISPAGEISGLQRKPGQGIDLRQFGRASIERASEIVWSEGDQTWEVAIMTGPFAGRRLTGRLWSLAGLREGEALSLRAATVNAETPIQFPEYDDAVKAEIAFLDAIRVKGLF